MLNIDAPPNTFAYKIAVENKQLGWFLTDYKFNLFDLIFETIDRLKDPSLSSYYFDWELELSFLFTLRDYYSFDASTFLVGNIPYILQNAKRIEDILKTLNLGLKKGSELYYLDFIPTRKVTLLPYLVKHSIFSNLIDFWRYFFYYSKANVKENVQTLLDFGCEETFPYLLVQKSPHLFSNISKQNLKLLSDFSHTYYEHNLFFINPTNLKDVRAILKLEKKYDFKFYALLEKLQRLPTEKELVDWEFQLQIKEVLDVKVSILPNKKLEVEYGWCVYELTTISELKEEAKVQKNCLSGYVSELQTSHYRFFSIRKKDLIFSALFREDTLKELKGFKNKGVGTYPREIKEELEYVLLIITEKIKDGNQKLISKNIFG
jgi:hypothetical protein